MYLVRCKDTIICLFYNALLDFFLCIANHSFGIKRSSSLTKVAIISEPRKFFNIIFVNKAKIFFMLNNAKIFGGFNYSSYLCIVNKNKY